MQHLWSQVHNKANITFIVGRGTCNKMGSKYKWEATTLEGFAEQLAVAYIATRPRSYLLLRAQRVSTEIPLQTLNRIKSTSPDLMT